jgi:hypothetical protein
MKFIPISERFSRKRVVTFSVSTSIVGSVCNPYEKEIPEEHNILAPRDHTAGVILQRNGILKLQVMLSPTKRDVNESKRQMSFLYRVNYKERLSDIILKLGDPKVSKADGTRLNITGFKQVYEASINNVNLSVSLEGAISNLFDEKTYTRAVVARLMEKYYQIINSEEMQEMDPLQVEKVLEIEEVESGPFNVGAVKHMVILTYADIVKPSPPKKQGKKPPSVSSDEVRKAKRNSALTNSVTFAAENEVIFGKKEAPPVETPGTFNLDNLNSFSVMSNLPYVATVIESVVFTPKKDYLFLGRAALSEVYSRLTPDIKDPADPLFGKAKRGVVNHTVNIVSRHTIFTITKTPEGAGEPTKMEHATFQVFQDGLNCEQANMNALYLGAKLHELFLEKLRELWSQLVSISGLEFTTFGAKEWDKYGETSAVPLVMLANGNGSFDSCNLVFGKNSVAMINRDEQLLFKVGFTNVVSNERTLRSIPLTVFTDPLQLVGEKALISAVTNKLRANLPVLDYPGIELVPIYKRGTKIMQAEFLVYSGLVSHASARRGRADASLGPDR